MLWLAIFITIALIYLAATLYLVFNERRIVYVPEKELVATPDEKGMDYTDVHFRTQDGRMLHGWYVPSPDARGVILFCHGNTGNISNCLETLEIFRLLQFDTLIFDYGGYGRSEGLPDEQNTYQDALAAWRYLTEERATAAEDVILFGRSLGGAIATWLATQVKPRALVVESTFTSLPEAAQRVYPWFPVRLLARLRYDSRACLKDVHCPLLVIHSRTDGLVPFDHAQELLDAAAGPKHLLEIHGNHADGFLMSGHVYTSGLNDFFSRHLGNTA